MFALEVLELALELEVVLALELLALELLALGVLELALGVPLCEYVP